MPDAFSSLPTHEPACDRLRAAIADNRVGHAYLFCGTDGSNAASAARAFATALVCECGGCGSCKACTLVAAGTHLDLHFLEPAGACYSVEQIREVVADVSLAPVFSRRRAYVFAHAEALNDASANAFLKTLEEPPADAVFILVAPLAQSVIETIASRTMHVSFAAIAPARAVELVAKEARVPSSRARAALAACAGSLERAAEFARSDERQRFRSSVLEVLACLPEADSWGLLCRTKGLDDAFKAHFKKMEAAHKAQEEELADVLDAKAPKLMQDRNHRAVVAAKRHYADELFGICESWLRDALALSLGQRGDVGNEDALPVLEQVAQRCGEGRIAAALRECVRTSELVGYNVSFRLCTDALFMGMKDTLYGRRAQGGPFPASRGRC